jgi:hypothetical protein
MVPAVLVLSVGCAPAPAGSAAVSPTVSGADAPATATGGAAGTAGTAGQRLSDAAGGSAGVGTSAAPGTKREVAGTSGDQAAQSTQPAVASAAAGNGSPSQDCLAYGQDVILRGVVEQPPPITKGPAKKGKNKASTTTAWRFRLDSPRCVGAPSGASEPVETMILVPLQDIAKTYRKLEGQHVEALGVLVGLVSGSEVHVVYMVRAFTPVPSTPE